MKILIASLLLTVATTVRAAAEKPARFSVATPSLTVALTADGEIIGPLRGRSELVRCRQVGHVAAKKIAAGGYAFTRTLTDAAGHRCAVTDRFTPAKDSIRWEVEVVADGGPWTAPIVLQLQVPAPQQTRFWTAWIDGSTPINPSHSKADGQYWRDPLIAAPLADKTWNDGNGSGSICIPIATVLDPATDRGLSLIVAPDQPLLWLQLATKADGTVRFQHNLLRFGGGRKVKVAADIVAHEADWRGGLRWMVSHYGDFFNPPNPKADELAGTASYSHHRGPLDPADVQRLKKMAYRTNWVASFDWPYFGLYLPPVSPWKSAGQDGAGATIPSLVREVSYASMNDTCREMKRHGFYSLSYFNVTEFGMKIAGPAAIKKDLARTDWWTDANTYLFRRMPHAILGPGLIHTWGGAVAMDPGDASFQKHLLEQAQRHIDELPDSAGIAIDRMDWLPHVNYAPGADDGIGWYDRGKAGRFLGLGWIDLLAKLGPLMHCGGKVIFVNCCRTGHRLDFVREVDGFYDEYGDNNYDLNGSGLLALRKPALMWTHDAGSIKPDADSYFQRHLHMGAYPTAPFPGNDHTILPDAKTDQYYLDYGPLLDAMRGKKWVLEPHCVETVTPGVKVNLFEVPGGYVMPVTFGGDAKSAVVRVRNVRGLERAQCAALQPGAEASQPVASNFKDGVLEIQVPLKRGCAVVRIGVEEKRG